ncbi:MAG: chorismate mutase [Acidobacteriaceae bacterium]|jgi:chorismate mutase
MMLRIQGPFTIAFIMISRLCMGQSQPGAEQLQPLVETSAHRLMIAEKVALAKWDSGAPVEDAPREAQVIHSAVEAGEAKGLDEASVTAFFRAQIEANKIVQYSLLADWRRHGDAPAHGPVSSMSAVRSELDQIQTLLIDELAGTAAIRARATCRADIAAAVGTYLSRHKQEVGQLRGIALDRALGATCR